MKSAAPCTRVRVIDSHTGGEPTRGVIGGGPDLGSDFAWRARLAVNAQGFPEVDHVILYEGARNFVLCPGKAYDRSPCGTGTSARLSCLAADGRLAEGEALVQESIVGSTFRGSYRWLDRARGIIEPAITGTAFITGEATLVFDPRDPFCYGIPTSS